MGCKIIAFEVEKKKKKTSFIPYKIGSTNFESSSLKNFAPHKVEDFDIMSKIELEIYK
jgi:hypothetical protein